MLRSLIHDVNEDLCGQASEFQVERLCVTPVCKSSFVKDSSIVKVLVGAFNNKNNDLEAAFTMEKVPSPDIVYNNVHRCQ